jgi:tripartite-type tricarboxylate transporter receptor subunit TctC
LITEEAIVRATIAGLIGITIAASAPVHPAHADQVADFYKGKSVSIVVGHQTGTGFDIYARLLARHLGRQIPGNPTIVVQNMVGASGLTAANWLDDIAPKDGTVMATFVHTVPFEPVFGNKAARFDAAKWSWIGNMEEGVGICGVSRDSGIAAFDDLMHKETVLGATGATGPLGKFAQALRHLTGARLKIVYGYKGSADVKLAINRGEVQGVCGISFSTITSFWRDDFVSGKFKVIMQLSGKPSAELKGVPHVDGLARTDEERKLFGLVFATQVLGRLYASPPGQPAPRTRALRTALMATMHDREFLADAEKTKIPIDPMSGEEAEALFAKLSSVPQAVVERAKQVFSRD